MKKGIASFVQTVALVFIITCGRSMPITIAAVVFALAAYIEGISTDAKK